MSKKYQVNDNDQINDQGQQETHDDKLSKYNEIEMKIERANLDEFEMIKKKEIEKTAEIEKESRMINEIIESALDSKVHGISNMVRLDNKVLKIIWVLIFTASAGYCLFLITTTLIAFFEFKVVTKITVKYEMPTLFPAVGFCNLNPYDGNTASNELNQILNNSNFTKKKHKNAIEFVRESNRLFKSTFENKSRNVYDKFNTYDNGFYLNQILVSCKFQGKSCDSSDFFYFHDYDYGSCYTFNRGKSNNGRNGTAFSTNIKKLTSTGWENGLQLELYIGNPTKQQEYTFKGGVRVFVHNQSTMQFTNDNGIDAGAGQQTNIAIKRLFVNRLESPYSNCINYHTINWKKNEVLTFMKESFEFEEYDQVFCFKVCQQLYILNNCECYDVSFPIKDDQNKNICFEKKQLECLVNYTNKFFSEETKNCYSKCNVECENVFYGLTTSFASYPSEWYSDHLINNSKFVNLVVNNTYNYTMPSPTFELLQQTILMVNVYYQDMFYTLIEDEPKINIEAIISQIGTYLALFLGVSILSVVEVLEILFLLLYHSTIRYFKQKSY